MPGLLLALSPSECHAFRKAGHHVQEDVSDIVSAFGSTRRDMLITL